MAGEELRGRNKGQRRLECWCELFWVLGVGFWVLRAEAGWEKAKELTAEEGIIICGLDALWKYRCSRFLRARDVKAS